MTRAETKAHFHVDSKASMKPGMPVGYAWHGELGFGTPACSFAIVPRSSAMTMVGHGGNGEAEPVCQ